VAAALHGFQPSSGKRGVLVRSHQRLHKRESPGAARAFHSKLERRIQLMDLLLVVLIVLAVTASETAITLRIRRR
jgi:hypothetical protein